MIIKLAPSLMCADLRRLGEQVHELDEAGVDLFHFDIMDGHFVNNFALSPMLLAALRDITKLPFEAHLMISNPEKYLEDVAKAGANIITVQVEVCNRLYQVTSKIRELGCVPALAVNPATPLCFLEHILPEVGMVVLMTVDPGFAGQKFIPAVVPKIRQLRKITQEMNLDIDIMVDGQINRRTISTVVEAGANVLVLGTSGLFSLPGSFQDNIRAIRAQAETALRETVG
ncbi:MAG: ribulose-phosphate 3-epimerase [Anaerolineae bacterium]